jgi:hypothetical protein
MLLVSSDVYWEIRAALHTTVELRIAALIDLLEGQPSS